MSKIYFEPVSKFAEDAISPPVPAYQMVPEWYKEMSLRINKDNNFHKMPNGESNLTMKACAPVFDSITAGYIVTSPADVVFVDPNQYEFRVIWDVSWNVVESHSQGQINSVPIDEKFEEYPLKWNLQWKIKTDPGYSCLVVHPFYRNDLPFTTMPAIVDTDSYPLQFNLPFLINKDFTGTIPEGTPIAQIIPFKREKWSGINVPFVDKGYFEGDILRQTVFKAYKKKWWRKKSYR